jgi:hypothetical protein
MSSMNDSLQLVGAVKDAAVRLLELPVPGGFAAMEETDCLLESHGLLALAVEARIGVVEKEKTAKAAGHSSTSAWLRAGGRMGKYRAGMLRRDAIEFARLPRVAAAVGEGQISHDMASAIAAATKLLGKNEDVTDTEEILLNLALQPDTTPEKIAVVGRRLRELLDPDGALSDEEKAYGNRYLSVHVNDAGAMSGSFYLPPEAAAKLQAVLDKYARDRDAVDERTQAQRNVDAFIQVLNAQVSTEIIALVNAESLPDDHPHLRHPDPGAERSEPEVTRERDGLDEEAADRLRLVQAALADEAEPLPCKLCGRAANRQTPGTLLPTGHVVPARHIQRLLYSSRVYRAILDAKGRVLDASYATRLVPDWMRRLILIQYPTCGYDDCPVEAGRCEMDHVYSWALYQRTRPDEIIPACSYHNRNRADHPDRYRLTKTADGRWLFKTTGRQRR